MMSAIWLLTLPAVQDPAAFSHVPQRPGLTLVQAVQGDTVLGNSRGDYELAITLTTISPDGAELLASSLVRNNAGRREWLHFRRTVLMTDLRAARTQILGFNTDDSRQLPGTTALGPSVAVMAEAQRNGRVEVRVRNYADRWDNPGTLRRLGVEAFPVLLNGRRVTLPAVHLRGQLGPPGHLRPWWFWFLDDPVQPITLKVSFGAEGAPESASPEWMRQVIRIDVPDAGSGVGAPGVIAGPELRGDSVALNQWPGSTEFMADEGAGDVSGAGPGKPPGGAGVATGTGESIGNGTGSTGNGGAIRPGAGTGAGTGSPRGMGPGLGLGAMTGMARDLTTACRVVVPGVYFEFDSDELNPASAPWIRAVADLLNGHREWTVTIEGHTDSIGGVRYNQDLSERRAAALKRELVTRHAVTAGRLGIRGFGASRPLEPNTTIEGRARNRRVELVRPCGAAER